jgi:hypothetical protein
MRYLAPLCGAAGEREGSAPKAWEGEVALPSLRLGGATYLAPTLSPRKRAEREPYVHDIVVRERPAA